jgi:branched-chain amino acid transport system ATP-binding protein
VTPVFEARDISVRFGGVHAVSGVDVEVREGQLVGLIGPNGAGKTTLIDAITGFVPARGRVALDGRDLSRLAPHLRARHGLARTWQSIELFDDLTVSQNVAVAEARPSVRATLKELFSPPRPPSEAAHDALRLLGLESVAEAMPGDLSQGQRKLVGVARALAANPRMICLDEPAAGLDTEESRELGERFRGVVDGGLSMLLIDHDMGLVLGISDYIVVLDFGKVIAVGRPEEIRQNPLVVAAYLGGADQDSLDRRSG